MPPTSEFPRPSRPASGYANKQNPAPTPAPAPAPAAAAANRQNVVLAAIPLPYMNKQSNSTRTTAANSSSSHAPTPSASSSDLPVPSLEVALFEHESVPTKNGVKGQHPEMPGPVAAPPFRQEQRPQGSSLQMNGADYPSANVIPGANYAAEAIRGANDDPSFASQSQLAMSTTKKEFAPSFPPMARPLPHPQHMVDQHHHPAVFHGPHPHPMHPHQHGHQMSNGGGGIMFGAVDSHTPSPAPLLGGFMPPPPMNGENRGPPRPNGHHHSHSNSSGFPGPIDTRFRENMMPMDAYGMGPAPAPPAHIETYVPGAGRYGPPTPHSFHGSHTSGEPNGIETAPLPYHPTGAYPYVRHEHPAAHHHPHGPFPPFMPPQPMSRQFDIANDEVMGGVHYIRSLFRNGDLSDCRLELVSAKGRHHPVKICGHKFILARSPVLKQKILNSHTSDRDSNAIIVETDDAYFRADAWLSAVQHLYLYQHQLPQPHNPMLGNAANGMEFAGDNADQFSFCLGYAAAGHALDIPEVLIRGLEVAANILTWNTIETGLGFVLENTIQRHFDHVAESEEASPSTFLEFGYGCNTEILLAAIVNFLVSEFPPNFELNTSVQDTPQIARIPIVATTTIANTTITTRTRVRTSRKIIPAIARGTTICSPAKQARLSSIKFGDLPAAYPDDVASPQREPAKCSSILSLILLNLPYDQLCQVLTSGSNGVSGWNTAQDRYHAVAEVVAEREERRLRAVEAVRSDAVPHALEIQSRLSSPHRFTIAEKWDVLNWQEEVIHGETPRIIRRWIPQFDVAPQPTRPAPLYELSDSMV